MTGKYIINCVIIKHTKNFAYANSSEPMSTDDLFACGLTLLQQAEVCERTHTFVLKSIRSRLFSLSPHVQYCTWRLLGQYRVRVRHRYWYWYHSRMWHWEILWLGDWCTLGVTTSTTPQTLEGFPHIPLHLGAVVLELRNDEPKVDEPKNNNGGENDFWSHCLMSLFHAKFPKE